MHPLQAGHMLVPGFLYPGNNQSALSDSREDGIQSDLQQVWFRNLVSSSPRWRISKLLTPIERARPDFWDFLQYFPGAEITSRNRPVDQIQIHIIQFEPVQASFKSTLNVSQTLCGIPYFCSNKKFISRYSTAGDSPSYIFFALYTEAVSIRRYPDSTAEIIAFSASFSPVALYTPSPSKRHLCLYSENSIIQNNSSNSYIHFGQAALPDNLSKYNIKMCQKYIKILVFARMALLTI